MCEIAATKCNDVLEDVLQETYRELEKTITPKFGVMGATPNTLADYCGRLRVIRQCQDKLKKALAEENAPARNRFASITVEIAKDLRAKGLLEDRLFQAGFRLIFADSLVYKADLAELDQSKIEEAEDLVLKHRNLFTMISFLV